jgi:phosphoribosylformylglycinamidine cyclo-ligase
VGIDLVAMNVNDLLCLGAKPLFFLDYIACGKLKSPLLNEVMRGIVRGCELAGCPLLGGETAQMPGMYKGDEYDLAGFAVGVVEKNKIIDGRAITEGDCILGLAASGLHSNGFSLVRKVFSLVEQKKYAKELLRPTRIYVKPILRLIGEFPNAVKGLAHVTGGAYYKKVAKIVPEGKCFKIDQTSWPTPEIFQRIQKKGHLSQKEMFTTFNMGIGMVLVVSKSDAEGVRRFLSNERVENWEIGEVVGDRKRKVILGDFS